MSTPESHRKKVARTLRKEIQSGRHAPETSLPGEHSLCERFQISRPTLRLALDDLAGEGLIYRIHGKGTFVRAQGTVSQKPVALLLKELSKATTPGQMELIAGASSALHPAGSHLLMIGSSPKDWSPALVRTLLGVIAVPRFLEQDELTVLERAGLPVMIAYDSDLAGPGVSFKIGHAMRDVTRALLAAGHRRIALLSGHDEHSDRAKKAAIFAAQVAVSGTEILDYATNYELERGREAAAKILALKPRPTAVIAFDDALAMQMVAMAKDAGLRVPDDISVFGCNDAPFARFSDPPLSTIHLPVFEAGRVAASCLLRGEPGKITLKYRLVWRASCLKP